MDQEQKLTPDGQQPSEQDAKIISTTYAPLVPPYQIIKWSGSVGMQIGTFIVTVQKPGSVNGLGYHIETHSHPVVAYENKHRFIDPGTRLHGYDPQLYSSQVMEGTVWDFVELKDVRTICLAKATMKWDSYAEFIRRELLDAPPEKLPNTPLVLMLERFGVTVDPIGYKNPLEIGSVNSDLTIWLDHMTTDKWGGRSIMCTRRGSPIVLCSDDNKNFVKVMNLLVKQLYKWATLFFGRPNLGGEFLNHPFKYATDVDSILYKLVIKELNRRYTTVEDILTSGGNYHGDGNSVLNDDNPLDK